MAAVRTLPRVMLWLVASLLAACAADCDPQLPRFARPPDAGRRDGGRMDAGASSEAGARDSGEAPDAEPR